MDVCATPHSSQNPRLALYTEFGERDVAARVFPALEKEMASPRPLQMIDLAGRRQAGSEGAGDPAADESPFIAMLPHNPAWSCVLIATCSSSRGCSYSLT